MQCMSQDALPLWNIPILISTILPFSCNLSWLCTKCDHQMDNKWHLPLGCVICRVGIDLLVMKEAPEYTDHWKITLRPAAPP